MYSIFNIFIDFHNRVQNRVCFFVVFDDGTPVFVTPAVMDTDQNHALATETNASPHLEQLNINNNNNDDEEEEKRK